MQVDGPPLLGIFFLTFGFFHQANLMVQEARLQKATDELNAAQEQLDEKQRELDVVQAKYDQAMRDKQTLVDDAEACRRKMANATALIDGLGGEKTRWTEQSKKFEQQIQRCVGNGFKMPLCCRLEMVVELAGKVRAPMVA